MREKLILRSIVLASGLVLGGLAPWSVGAQKPSPPAASKAAGTGQTLPKIWRSETTHQEYRLRIEQDVFYADWINLPPDAAKLGAYIHTECRRLGNKWIGTTRVLLACAKSGDSSGKVSRACPMTLQFEVDSISPERITGRGQSLRDFDCEKCEVRKTGWGDFVWVPKR